jgi:hypothetical protein
MSNNPGKKGKPAPWMLRERQDRESALEAFILERVPDYREWRQRRSAAYAHFQAEGRAEFPGLLGISDAMKLGDRKLRTWDKKNPSPLTWAKSEELRHAFEAQYVPVDRS